VSPALLNTIHSLSRTPPPTTIMSNSGHVTSTTIIQDIHPIPDTSPTLGLDVYALAYSDLQNGDPDTADECKKC
jgi:hypothetical protein